MLGCSKEFYVQRIIERSLNATFFVLIPKNGGVEYLKGFKPISWWGTYTKSY